MLSKAFCEILQDLCDTKRLNILDNNIALNMLSNKDEEGFEVDSGMYDYFTDKWLEIM